MGLLHSFLSIMADMEGCAYESSAVDPHAMVSDQISAILEWSIQASGRFGITFDCVCARSRVGGRLSGCARHTGARSIQRCAFSDGRLGTGMLDSKWLRGLITQTFVFVVLSLTN